MTSKDKAFIIVVLVIVATLAAVFIDRHSKVNESSKQVVETVIPTYVTFKIETAYITIDGKGEFVLKAFEEMKQTKLKGGKSDDSEEESKQ